MSKVDWTKPVQTRDGREAQVFATDMGGEFPVLVRWKNGSGWNYGVKTLDGKTYLDGYENCVVDIVNAPRKVKIERWMNVFANGKAWTFLHKDEADRQGAGRIACKHLIMEIEEGEGLS